jgi:hypothetical protein
VIQPIVIQPNTIQPIMEGIGSSEIWLERTEVPDLSSLRALPGGTWPKNAMRVAKDLGRLYRLGLRGERFPSSFRKRDR